MDFRFTKWNVFIFLLPLRRFSVYSMVHDCWWRFRPKNVIVHTHTQKTLCCGFLRPSAVGYNELKPFLWHVKFYDSTTKKTRKWQNRSIHFQHSPLFLPASKRIFGVQSTWKWAKHMFLFRENRTKHNRMEIFCQLSPILMPNTSESTDTFFSLTF